MEVLLNSCKIKRKGEMKMGYRSDVAIHIRDIDFEDIKNFDDMPFQNFLNEFSVKKHYDDTITLSIEGVKWYVGFDREITMLTMILKKIPHIFVRIGDEVDDNEWYGKLITDDTNYLYDYAPLIARQLDIQ